MNPLYRTQKKIKEVNFLTEKPPLGASGKVSLAASKLLVQDASAKTTEHKMGQQNQFSSSFSIGDHVLVQREDNQLQHAIVKFCGYTKFCEGVIWVGVELDQTKGKNDGSVLVSFCEETSCACMGIICCVFSPPNAP